jgi:hypothetical protein
MKFDIGSVGGEFDDEIDEFLLQAQGSLIYYTPTYRKFLQQILPDAVSITLIAREAGRIVGILPSFLQSDLALGRVANSLPFFGSHGGAVVAQGHPLCDQIGNELYDAYMNKLHNLKVSSATIIENLFLNIDDAQREILKFDVVDDRVGQFTRLPAHSDDTESRLFSLIHQKTRNSVRKGMQSNLTFAEKTTADALMWLQATHEASIRALGGQSKPLQVFEALTANFPLGERARLWLAYADGKPVAGILFLVHLRTIEYFTPVVLPEFREKQALPALIFHCMCRFADEGFDLWNWGGTWRSQEGVYRFKQRWGAEKRVYRYFNRIFDPSIIEQAPETIRASLPWFYLYRY